MTAAPIGLFAQVGSPVTALVRHAPQIDGTVSGSVQLTSAENLVLTGSASISGELLVPGTPTVTVSGNATLGGTTTGSGAATPSGYTITLAGKANLGTLRIHSDGLSLRVLTPVPAPQGVRSVSMTAATPGPGDFSTLRDLVLNGTVGQVVVPAGSYGNFSAASGGGFTLGVSGAAQPVVYNFQQLVLSGTAKLMIAGPVVINLAGSFSVAGSIGSAAHPDWLAFNLPAGNFSLANGTTLNGYVTAPAGTVTLGASSHFTGGVISDRLVVGSNAVLKLVAVNEPPTVALLAPADQAIFLTPATITLQAQASDSDGAITKVEFFRGATKLGQARTAPYRYDWTPTVAGSFAVTAKATDNNGATATSAAVTVVVNTPPHLTLTAPANGAILTSPATIILRATASDAGGAIAKVEFFNGPTKLGEALKAPFQYNWIGVAVGSYTLTAKATDNLGATATSAASSVTVKPPPGVILTAPGNGTVIPALSGVTLQAAATDTGGTITKVEFFDGRTKLGEALAAPFQFSWPAVPAGTHTLTAKATNNIGAATTSTAVTLIANAPPTVSIAAPLNGATVTAPATITIKASATDPGGSVAKVEFFNGATKLGEAAKAPFQIIWPGVAAGAYTLTAKVTDNYGATATSGAITVNVNAPPTVALTAPAPSTVVTAPGSVTLQATASDSDGTVAKVEFFRGTTKLGEATAAPFQFAWANIVAGSYALTAKATDNRGAIATSAAVTLIVNARPTITLTAPANGAVVTAPANVTLKATAADTGGSVAKVEFFNGTTKLGEATKSPYQFSWAGVAAGTYALTARVTDNYGATTDSSPSTLIVNAPPAVTLTSPPTGTIAITPATVTLQATATDADGTIAKVEFFRGTTKLGEATATPFQFTWANVGVGSYALTAKATDNRGAITTSAAVTLIANTLPTVTLTAPANNTVVTAPATLTVKASATDPGGSVAKVEFFNGATKVGEALKAPYQFVWTAVPAGTYSLTAKVTDNLGATTTSNANSVTVNAPPVVALTAPVSGTVLNAPASVTLQATSTDADGTIAKVQFFRGTTKLGEATVAPFQFTWNNAAAGTYTLTAKAFDDHGATTTSAPATLTVNALPTVKITTPANNAKFSAPAAIAMGASAADTDGTVTRVEFFSGTTKLGESTTPPYQYFWSGVVTGNYSLTAKATDNQGALATSAAINIQVTGTTTPPMVAITSPPSNAVVTASAPLTLTATAAVSGATIATVEFFNGTTKLGDATPVAGQSGSYGLTLASGLPAGTYSLTARATDSKGTVANSVAVTLIVNAPPGVALTAPANNAVFAVSAPVTLTATATDPDGTIAKVEFFGGVTKLGESAAAPYTLTLTDLAAGSYTFTARATDNRGAITSSTAVVTIVDNAPVVTLTAPGDGAVFVAGADLTLQATASDADGTIAKVEFFNGATKVGEAVTAPYQMVVPAAPAGSYTLTAKATDNLGIATTSDPVAIVVDSPPTVALTAPANNATFAAPATLTLTAAASDTDGAVTKVEFFSGATKLGEATAAPFQFSWSAVPADTYVLTAVATDDQGVRGTSAPVAIIVDSPPANAVTIQGGSATLSSPARVTLLVDTGGSTGAIARVEFYRAGALIGTVTNPAPGTGNYSFTDPSALLPGIYVYRTRVYDAFGFYTDSVPIAVTVLAGLPYLADFEAAQGYTLGSLDGQLGWTVGQGTAQIAASDFFLGARSVFLAPSSPATQIAQAFAPPSPNLPVVFADFYAKPDADADLNNATTFDVGSARFAFLASGAGPAVLQAYHGDGVGGGAWVPANFSAPLATGNQTQNWIRLTARLDFTRKTWDLYAAGSMALADLGFRDNASSYLALFALQGHPTGGTLFDYFLAGGDNPLFADVNGNGIDDAWETAHGLSLANYNRTASPTGNGVTVLQAYLAGTDPNDYFSGQPPLLSVVGGDNGTAQTGQFNTDPLSVLVISADGTSVFANAPVTFTITSGGGALATTSGATAATYTVLAVRTGADGVARVFFKQPVAPAIVSQITVAAGAAQVTMTANSVAAGSMAVAAGRDFSLALKNDGTVWGWGRNTDGQLGGAAGADRAFPVNVAGLSGVGAIAAGSWHGLALKFDGTVWGWGRNVEGELGLGSTVSTGVPAQIFGLPNVKAITAGSAHSLALSVDGTVWAWGYNADGELGNGDTASSLTPVQVPGLSGVVAIAAGALHSMALKSDGTVWTWGYNADGELGNGSSAGSLVPVPVATLSGIIAIAAGDSHSLAVKSNGTVWAWGFNQFGQLGDGTTTNRLVPVQVIGAGGVVAVKAGGGFSLALKNDGTALGWGSNEQGQLGDGAFNDWLTPSPIAGISNVVGLAAGWQHTVLLKSDGSVWARGDDVHGQLGNGTSGSTSSLTATAIAAGGYHRLALMNDGSVWSSWYNASGQLGDGTTTNRLAPVQTNQMAGISKLAAGANHSLAIANDGNIWVWGANDYGQLGDGSTTDQSAPVAGPPLASPVAVAAGGYHSVGLGYDGSVWAWGGNQRGQLGDGTTIGKSTPIAVSAIGAVVAVAAGNEHSLAVKSDGTVSAWGSNSYGELGDGTTGHRAVPLRVPGLTNIAKVAAGGGFSLALARDGSVWAWGNNQSGQLGDGSGVNRTSPVRVAGLSGVTAIAAGAAHGLALKADGTVVAWGNNSYRQLGDGTATNRLAAVPVAGLAGVRDISAGAAYSLALLTDGTVRDWGNAGLAAGSFFPTAQLAQSLIQLLQSSAGSNASNSGPVTPTPATYSSGQSVNLSITGGDGQFGLPGALTPLPLSVSVWNSSGTTPVAGAPVVFNVGQGGGLLVGTSSGATTVTVLTDSNGGARISYRQPSTPNVVSQISATVGASRVDFTSTSSLGAIASGNSHTLLLKSNGTVSAWGAGSDGQLGDGAEQDSATAVEVAGLTNVISVSANGSNSMVLRGDGTVWTWGNNDNGQLGYDTDEVQSVPAPVSELSGVVAISMGSSHAVALKNDGTVWAWGNNSSYQLGDGTWEGRSTPMPVPNLEGVIAVAAGESSTVAIKGDGSIWRWGFIEGFDVDEDENPIGGGPRTDPTVPTKLGQLNGAIAAAAGAKNFLILKSDGTVWIIGDTSYEHPDDLGDSANWSEFTQVPGLTGIVAVAARGRDFLALQSTGAIWEWGQNPTGNLAATPNKYGSATPMRVRGVANALVIAAGGDRNSALLSDGSVWSWGAASGSSGSGTDASATAIAAGAYHRLALRSDGVLLTWGWNGLGQLGDGTTVDRASPTLVNGLLYPTVISGGLYHNLAVTADNSVWAWGQGILGDGVTDFSTVPVQVAGLSGVGQVAAGGTHSLAIRYGGEVWSWGYSSSGQLGDGTTIDRATPVRALIGQPVNGIAAGLNHSVALASDQTVWTWGNNSAGQLGSGNTLAQLRPVQVPGLDGIVAIAAGARFTLARRYDGTVWAWGENSSGQLGDGTTVNRTSPVQVPGLTGVQTIAAGASHSLAILEDGTVWAWGDNAYSQLGDGTTVNRSVPRRVVGLNGAYAVAGGATYSMVLLPDGSILDWGGGVPFRYHFLGSGSPLQKAPAGLLGVVNNTPVTSPTIDLAAIPKPGPSVSTAYVSGGAFKLELRGGGNQLGQAGRFNLQPFDVLVWNSTGTGPVTNAPVVFNVTVGGGGLATASGSAGPLATSISVTTGADGVARIFFRQPEQTNAASLITANLGSAQVVFSSRSVTHAVALGSAHSLVLKSDGTVWAWGRNAAGQLGDGTTVDRASPSQVNGLGAVLAVAASGDHNLALKTDGTVWSWGAGGGGAFVTAPTAVSGISSIAAIAAGGDHYLALKADGTVWQLSYAPGGGAFLPPVQVVGLTEVIAIAAGSRHSLALRTNGTVWAWGDNASGQLGNGTTDASATPIQVFGLVNAVAVSAGDTSSTALLVDGSIRTWGGNASGQLGNSTTVDQLVPVAVDLLTGAVAISSGSSHMLALKSDGSVWTWGDNTAGQLGDGTNVNQATAEKVPNLFGVVAIAAGAADSAAQKSDGTIVTWGANTSGQLGDGTTVSRTPPFQPAKLTGVVATVAGGAHTLALENDGTIRAWGGNASGQLGDGTRINRAVPVTVAGLANVTALAAGNAHSLALRSDGTVWAWGANLSGQLGDGTTTSRTAPVTVTGLVGAVSISAGNSHSLAVRSDGTVWAWGNNSVGQLGDGTTANRVTPVQVSGLTGAVAVAAGDSFSLVLMADGSVWGWGNDFSCQLGDGGAGLRLIPVQAAGLTSVVGISAGHAHSLAVRSDGSVWAWGSNSFGQLGTGLTADQSVPAQISGLTQIVAVRAGGYHSVAVKNDGTVFVWGDNLSGQLGAGRPALQPTPVASDTVANSPATVAAGDQFISFIGADGTISGFGRNTDYQLAIVSSQFVTAIVHVFEAPTGTINDNGGTVSTGTSGGTTGADPSGAVRLQIFIPNP